MTEIHPRLFVGSRWDYEAQVAFEEGWYVVHAAKEPYHRQAVGYDGPEPPPDHPEHLVARRGARLMLNLRDHVLPVQLPTELFDAAVDFIHEGLSSGHRVLVHCEVGVSRSPTVGLLYLTAFTDVLDAGSLDEAMDRYLALYPDFSPGPALRRFLRDHWRAYAARRGS
ncbi:MAG: dual specificity protein phosphatase family protein [Candidatus Brocadiia bacterium]